MLITDLNHHDVEAAINRVQLGGPFECWPFPINHSGYASVDVRRVTGETITISAHRLAFLYRWGELDDALNVLHRCDNKRCCNPAHLWQGTQAENIADCEAKGRDRKASGAAHYASKVTPEDADAIRADPRPGKVVANERGISPALVSMIRNNKRWPQ